MRIPLLRVFLAVAMSLTGSRPVPAQSHPNTPTPILQLQRELQIGGDFGSDTQLLYQVGDIAVGPSGEILVLDRGDKVVKVFDRHGRFLLSLGRQGQGPGEFLHPIRVEVDSVVRVLDAGQQRVSTFTMAGAHRETRAFAGMSDVQLGAQYPLRGGISMGLTPARFSPGSAAHTPNSAVLVHTREGADTLLSFHSGSALRHPRGQPYPYGVVSTDFGAAGAWAVQGDSIIATVNGYSGEARWYRVDGGRLSLLHTRRLGRAGPLVTEGDLARLERRVLAQRGGKGRLEFENAPTRWSIASQALFADDGTLWVRSSVDADRGYVWTLLPPRSEASKRVRLPQGFDLHAVHANRLYGVARTENDAPIVQVYRMIWRTP